MKGKRMYNKKEIKNNKTRSTISYAIFYDGCNSQNMCQFRVISVLQNGGQRENDKYGGDRSGGSSLDRQAHVRGSKQYVVFKLLHIHRFMNIECTSDL